MNSDELATLVTYSRASLNQLKGDVEYWTLVYRRVSRAYSDILSKGWSILEYLIPAAYNEVEVNAWACNIETQQLVLIPTGEFEEVVPATLEQRAYAEFMKTADRLTKLESLLAYSEKELDTLIHEHDKVKTEEVAAQKRFELVWAQNKKFQFGEQKNLFQ